MTRAASESTFPSTILFGDRNTPLKNPIRNSRTLIGRKVAPPDLVLFDPQFRSFTIRQINFASLVRYTQTGAYLQTVVPIEQDAFAFPDDQGVSATFGGDVGCELAALLW